MKVEAGIGGRSVRLAGWLALPEPIIVEVVARTGFDWLGLDLQHGAWDLGTAFRGIQLADALGVPVLIRLPDEQLALIPRVLDHGASGVVLAMASEPAVVRGAVERARYQPAGLRSFGGQRYGLRQGPSNPEEVKPSIFAMIETQRGVEAIDEIAAVEGLAGIHVGPADLALGLGFGADISTPGYTRAVERIVQSAHDRGLPATMHAVAPEQVRRWVDLGFDELVLTTDIDLLRGAFAGLRRDAGNALGIAAEGGATSTGYMR